MQRIYKNAMDPYIAVRKVFVKSADAFAYEDAKCTAKVNSEDLYDAYIKGVLIVDTSGNEYIPVACKKTGSATTLTYVTADSTTPTTAKLATVKSA